MPTLVETVDAIAGATTTYSLASGQTAQGTLGFSGDRDWYRVELVAGQTYTFSMTGTGVNNVQDTYLKLYAPSGASVVRQDDNSLGRSSNSIFSYTATTSGAYYVEASSADSGTGQYGISFTAGTLASFDIPMAAGVMDMDTSWSTTAGAGATVSWAARETFPGSVDFNGRPALFAQLSSFQISAIQSALSFYSEICGLNFVRSGAGTYNDSASILFSNYNANDNVSGYVPGASTGLFSHLASSSDGDVRLNTNQVSASSLPFGSFSYAILLHEIGHAVGLHHPGNYNGGRPSYQRDAQFITDSEQYSVMSYFDESNTGARFDGSPQTLMMSDIYQLQMIYGVNSSTRSGDSIYGFGSNTGSLYDFSINSRPALCIWDGGGTDTLDVSGFFQNQVIYLEAGGFCSVGGFQNNVSFAIGAVIENAVGGSGNDLFILSESNVDNLVKGSGGSDVVEVTYAYGGDYELLGTAGNLVIKGTAGTDTLQDVESILFSNGVQIGTAVLAATIPVATYVSIGGGSIVEGDFGSLTKVVTVTRTGGTAPFSVSYTTQNGTAIAGSDYSATQGTLNFSEGVNSLHIYIPILGDLTREGDETFLVSLTSATNGATIIDGQAEVRIVDNDGLDDFADGLGDATSPFGRASLGAPATGSLEMIGDRDWFRIEVAPGALMRVDLLGEATSQGSLVDPFLRLYDSAGYLLASDDDGGSGLNSQLTYQVGRYGTFFIEASARNDSSTGTYNVRYTTVGPSSQPTDISLSRSSIAENSSNGTVVGALSTIDPDLGDFFSYALVGNADGLFALSGADLVVSGPLDYEAARSHQVGVRVTDSGGNTYDKQFVVDVEDVRERPQTNFNGDAFSDVLLQNSSTGAAYIWQLKDRALTGNGFAGWTPGSAWQAKGTGDFNGDGKSDILLQNASTGECFVWLLNGTSLVGSGAVGWRPGAEWQAKGTGDFNGDGKSDILLQNSGTGDCFVWELNGTSLVGSGAVGWRPGAMWQAKGTGDFNGDGRSDILLQNSGTGDCFIWELNGTSLVASGAVGWRPGAMWQAKGTGDFNGDGKSDILLQNSGTGDCFIWGLDGTNLVGNGAVGWRPGAAWQAKGTGDFNADGRSDIVLQNVATGDCFVWELNGTSLVGSGPVGWTPGPEWAVHV